MINQVTDDPTSRQARWETLPWQEVVAKYNTPARARSVWQIVNSVVPYLALWSLMVWSLSVSYWLTLPLAALAGAFLVRIFIIFHDCGHGSFFRSRKANDFWGIVTGLLTCTPYHRWRHQHAVHHATSGDLDRRGQGDIWTLTVQEYLEASRWKKFAYRLARNPFVLFVLAPCYLFLIQERFVSSKASRQEKMSVHSTNLALLAILIWAIHAIGIQAILMIFLPTIMVAAASGIWLFYVQHQFEGAYWQRRENWNYVTAALQGSSFYKLPKVLQWFSGNIGFHHIHHLSPSIPNYNLERCHRAEPIFQQVKPVTLLTSLKSLTYRLWDERRQRLVGFGHLRKLRRKQQTLAESKPCPSTPRQTQ